MVALLMVSEEKHDQFKRLIKAGGGSVIQARWTIINQLLLKKIHYLLFIIHDTFGLI